MGDVGEWLQRLGLGQYAGVFAEHDIDDEVLPDLTDQDLERLGVSLGHRKKLLRVIAALSETAPDAGSTPEFAAPREAERRQLTVLFCDLVGSTELSGRLDPEDMGALIRDYHAACTEVMERWGGHIAKYMGDGVLAYFGWPHAHEDEAERAVRAGLAIVSAVGRLTRPTPEPLAARVGIATGLVMVGELIGEGVAQEQTVVGETPNLAARLQALAAPGTVVISQATRRLVGGLFELDDLGPSPSPSPPGGSKARVAPKAGSRRSTVSGSPRWSGASTNSASCSSAGPGPRTVTARSCSCPASPGSASRA
jgi:class 3 adenylate cyclase